MPSANRGHLENTEKNIKFAGFYRRACAECIALQFTRDMKNTRFAMKNKAGMKSLTGKICRFFDKITHRAVGEAAPQPVEPRCGARVKCLRVGLVAVCTALGAWVGSVQAAEKVSGKITLKIEKKVLTPAQAQDAMTNKTPIWLRLSMVMRGEWVTRLKNSQTVTLGASSFSFAIVQSEGDNKTTAPYDTDPKAYILSAGTMNCSQDGVSLNINNYSASRPKVLLSSPSWAQLGCPIYEYYCMPLSSTDFVEASADIKHEGTDAEGAYIEIDIIAIGLILKPGTPQTIYVRGTDVDGRPTDDNPVVGNTSTRATQVNLRGFDEVQVVYGDGNTTDLTYCNSTYYGGCIPGGIFINTDAEVTPLVTFWV